MTETTLYTNAHLRHTSGLSDILVEDGICRAIGAGLAARFPDAPQIDLGGRLVCEPFVESHIHLDYVYTADLPAEPTASGTLFEAIDKWSGSKAALTADVIRDRAKQALREQIRRGVQYIRTHVDICDPKLTALHALLELREELRGVVDLQLVAFPQEGYYAYDGGAELVEEALRQGADVVGGIPHFEFTREDGVRSVQKAFELAVRYDKLVDLHCDETDDEQSRFVEVIAAEAYRTGLGGRAAASHTCAMGSYSNAYAFKMMSKFRRAGLNFISCPTENCYLQGRYDAYPRRRGLTRIDELTANGLNVSLGQDSISDPWYPLGSGDMIHQVDFALHLSHMMSVPQIQRGLDLVTVNGAKTLCLGEDYALREGNPASFIVIDADDDLDAIRRGADVLMSVRRGRILMRKSAPRILTEPQL